MHKSNADIEKVIKSSKMSRGDIAEALDVSESTLYRWLRHSMSPEQKQKIIKICKQKSN